MNSRLKRAFHRAVAVLLLLFLGVGILLSPADGALSAPPSPDVSAVDPGDSWRFDEASPLAETAEEGYSYAGENDRWAMFFNYETGAILITEKDDGPVWRSTPERFDEDEELANSVKMTYNSQLLMKYADQSANIYELSSHAYSVRQDGFQAEPIEGGVRAVYGFPKQGITIPVEYVLTEDGLSARVPLAEITEEDERYRLTGFSLLPYFGAGGREDEGYLVVPDGSGALIEFNNGKAGYGDYSQYLYGRDTAVEYKAAGGSEETALLPVYGVRNGDASMLAVIRSGASRAIVNAKVSSGKNAFNTVYSEFIYRDSTMASFNDKAWNKKEVRVFEEDPPALEEYAVTYYLLESGDTYVDMARRYREYLLEEGALTPAVQSGDYPLCVNLYGSVKTMKHVLGFPVDAETPLITYEDAREILEILREAGVEDMTLKYNAWLNGGPEGAIPTDVKPSGVLGGRKGLTELADYMTQAGIDSYGDINLTDMYKSRWGYLKSFDSAKMLNQSPAVQYSYKRSTGQQDEEAASWNLLNPLKVASAAEKAAEKLKGCGLTGAAADTLCHKLYSSFNEEETDRASAERLWAQSLEALRNAGGGLLCDAPNAYALPYATFVSSLPVQSSGYAVEDASIPFYQIVLHGILPYSMPSANQTSDHRIAVLRALETGSSLQYTWIARNTDKVRDTSLNVLYSANAADWLDAAADAYGEIRSFMEQVADQGITDHEILQKDLVRTTYGNGMWVLVNYADEAAQVDDVTVEARSYVLSGPAA